MSRSPWFWLVLLIGLTGILIYFLDKQFPGTITDPENGASVLRNSLWLILLLPALILRWKSRPKSSLRHLAIWLALFAGLTAIMTFREDAMRVGGRILGAASPTTGIETDEGLRFNRDANGHFTIAAEVNGQRVLFLLDTGASDIVLTREDAARVGISPDRLTFDRTVETANGIGKTASVRLDSLNVGPIAMTDIRASVNDADMNGSLLGMAFLNRLSSWRVEGDRLYLVP